MLIISPQAGLGNRLRAIAAAMVLARQTGRRCLHCWTPADATDPRPNVNALQRIGLEELFEPSAALPLASPHDMRAVSACFSEWVPGNGWYAVQSSAQRSWLLLPQNKTGGMPLADLVAASDAPVILLETSIAERLSPGLGGAASEPAWNALMAEAYAQLQPRREFRTLAEAAPAATLAITLRRGDLLQYNPESNQAMGDLRGWAASLSRRGPVAVFSDKAEAAAEVAAAVVAAGGQCIDYGALRKPGLPDHLRAFVDFLYIARCPVITGTPGSSFAFEAARFGNRRFVNNLDRSFLMEQAPDLAQDELSRLALLYGSDKNAGHSYTALYNRHFTALRGQPVTLLEIGIGGYEDPEVGGASLRMWRDYFAKGQIFGLDYHPKNIDEERIRVFQGSQADPRVLARLVEAAGPEGFDIIIDDGSHRSEHVTASFMMLFQFVKEGGWYVVEDTQTSYWAKFGTLDTEGARRLSMMEFFKNLVDGLNWREINAPGYRPNYTDMNVAELHFYHNIIFVRKGRNDEESNVLNNNRMPQWLRS